MDEPHPVVTVEVVVVEVEVKVVVLVEVTVGLGRPTSTTEYVVPGCECSIWMSTRRVVPWI